MGPVFRLSIRQITGIRRLLIVLLLVSLPVVLTLVIRLTSSEGGGDTTDYVNGVVNALIVGVVLPIVMISFSTSVLGNDLEDRTLSFIILTPAARWKIALSKLVAPILVGVPLVVASAAVSIYIGLDSDVSSVAAVCAGLVVGVVAYASVFTWAGLITTRALAFAIVYVFLWEGVMSALVPGVKYLSISAYALSVMYRLSDGSLEAVADQTIELPAALVGACLVAVAFWLLTVWRLRTMDVP